jgi:hypothetical protein
MQLPFAAAPFAGHAGERSAIVDPLSYSLVSWAS